MKFQIFEIVSYRTGTSSVIGTFAPLGELYSVVLDNNVEWIMMETS